MVTLTVLRQDTHHHTANNQIMEFKIPDTTYSTGHLQRNITVTNSYEQVRSFANKNEVRENEFIKSRINEVTTSFLIHENEFVIPNSW